MNGLNAKLWCWWCCYPIQTDVLQLPKEYNESKNVFIVYGNFCSFECMKTYNNNECGSYKQNRNTLISKMVRDMHGKHIDIIPAPPRECLEVFGGNLTIQEFRCKNQMMRVIFKPPLISQKHTTEIQATTSYRWINPTDKQNKDTYFTLKEFEESQKTKVTNVPMKMKLNNPNTNPVLKQNTLEKILGLTSKSDPKLS